MTTDPHAAATLTTELCATLECLEAALVSLDADVLLSTEERLGQLVDTLASIDRFGGSFGETDRMALASEIRRGQAALLRCRRLGASFTAIARSRLSRLTAAGGSEAYDRAGSVRQGALVGSSVKAAV